MEPWELWRDMALEAQKVALIAEEKGYARSSVSRYYYAAYQAVSAVLLYAGLIPPVGEEAWGHASTPDMIVEHFASYVRLKDERQKLQRQLSVLYKLRIMADYRGAEQLAGRISVARKCSNRLVKVALEILPKGS
jgi:uncharacterized protein (UPF0332 family)